MNFTIVQLKNPKRHAVLRLGNPTRAGYLPPDTKPKLDGSHNVEVPITTNTIEYEGTYNDCLHYVADQLNLLEWTPTPDGEQKGNFRITEANGRATLEVYDKRWVLTRVFENTQLAKEYESDMLP